MVGAALGASDEATTSRTRPCFVIRIRALAAVLRLPLAPFLMTKNVNS